MFSASKSGQYQGYQISRSVRLRSSASAYFNRTPASAATNGQKWTYSAWVKRGALGAVASLLSADAGGGTSGGLYFDTDNTLKFGTGATLHKTSAAVFRDPSAWYHIVVVADSTLATGANRLLLYINGVQQTWTSGTDPTLNGIWLIGKQSTLQGIGFAVGSAASTYFDGYMTEINFIDGQTLTPSSFGVTNAYGVWSPIKYNGTYGNNGFYLNFSDNSSNTATTIGKDSSGNGNNWTPNNISVTSGTTYDSMLDVPTPWGDGGNGRGNYATLNPLKNFATLSGANLQFVNAGGSGYYTSFATSAMESGKFYWEVTATDDGVNARYSGFGIADPSIALPPIGSGLAGTQANNVRGWMQTARSAISGYTTGLFNNGGSINTTVRATTSGTRTFMIAYDAGTGKCWMGYEGTWWTGNPSAGTGEYFTAAAPMMPVVNPYNDGSNGNLIIFANFGQRPFAYTPPSGFNALNTFNLPEPSIDDGRLYMAATTYTGTGASLSVNNTVNNVSFQPDFVWVKGRSGATDHALYDAVRGVQKQIESNTTTAETTETTGLTAFNSNGFTVGALAQMNTNTATYVGWQWNAGGSNATNTSGTITSTVRANTKAGFSIVTYTGNLTTTPSAGAMPTVGHGLGVAPKLIISKSLNVTGADSGAWAVFSSVLSTDSYLRLNTTAATASVSGGGGGTMVAPTSTVFSTPYISGSNVNANNYVAYLFAEIVGFSRIGSYTGNGSADGPFVFCGFRPRLIIIKRTDSISNWTLRDTSRSASNTATAGLYADTSAAETTQAAIDILSNGFKCRDAGGGATNASGGTYIFAAFAENPFKYSLAR